MEANEENAKPFQYEYMIFNPEHAMLTHIIRTKAKLTQKANYLPCDNEECEGAQEATVHCKQCKMYLCESCNSILHEEEIGNYAHLDQELQKRLVVLSKAADKHDWTHITDREVDFDKCEDHKERPNEYYDLIRNKAFCMQCAIDIMQGKRDTKNNLVPIADAYYRAKWRAENQEYDQVLQQRVQNLRAQLGMIEQNRKIIVE